MHKDISIFSFFAGIGFLDLGFELNDYDVKFVNEYIPAFVSGYKYSREKMGLKQPEYGYSLDSVSEFTSGKHKKALTEMIDKERSSQNLVGFIAGPPCPDFSVAGKNRGRNGENGKLSAIYMDIICQQKPDFFLFENVKGLWRTKKHREFYDELKKRAEKQGYVLFDRLINALEYGAPQSRERIILLGFRKDTFGINKTDVFPWDKNAIFNKEETLLSRFWPTTTEYVTSTEIVAPHGIVEELTVEHWFKKNNVTKHPNSAHHFIPRAGLKKFESLAEGDDSKKSYKRLHRWRYSPTAAYGNNEVHIHPYLPRRISVAEALAIQSLPANFELPDTMTLTDMFKAVGNGVPFMAASAVAQTIKGFVEMKTPHVNLQYEINSRRLSKVYQ